MNDKKQLKTSVLVLCSGLVFHSFFGFHYHIDKYTSGWLFFAIILLGITSFFAICYFLISGVAQIIRHRRNLTVHLFLPATLALIILFFPIGFDSETMMGEIEMRACYEGTQNQSTIKFRADKSFEVHSTGIFFSSRWYEGKWRKTGDTIFMKFDKEKPNRLLSDTMVILEDNLYPISNLKYFDSLKNHRRYYYLGYCRGEN